MSHLCVPSEYDSILWTGARGSTWHIFPVIGRASTKPKGRKGAAALCFPRTPCMLCVSARAHRFLSPHTLCMLCAPARAHRCCRRRNPCTSHAAARAHRCRCHRNPCSCHAAARARRCCCPHSPCTGCAAARARRCRSRRTPCTCCAAAREDRAAYPSNKRARPCGVQGGNQTEARCQVIRKTGHRRSEVSK